MIGFGFWDGSNNEFATVNDNVLNLLDFPMENLESDEFGEDLDEKFRSLGPIDREDLQILLSQSNSNSSVQSEQTCHLNKDLEFDEDPSGITCRETRARPEPPCSPISLFSSSISSCSSEKTTPSSVEKSDSLDPPFDTQGSRKSKRTKKPSYKLKKTIKECQKVTAKKNQKQKSLSTQKCLHCESTKTPQWRHGPMGKNTLCNACGVAYMKGRLLREYRPPASPTKKPSYKLKKTIMECQKATAKKNQKQNSLSTKKCLHCESTETPQWRHGPMGKNTLCNACGVAYMKGRLLPEYRPAASPTFVPDLHSNLHKKVVGMRQ